MRHIIPNLVRRAPQGLGRAVAAAAEAARDVCAEADAPHALGLRAELVVAADEPYAAGEQLARASIFAFRGTVNALTQLIFSGPSMAARPDVIRGSVTL